MIAALDSVASTQDLVRERLLADASREIVWLRARHQSAGRGRQGRNWASDAPAHPGRENLLLSCGFRTRGEALPWPFVSILAGAALFDCVSQAWSGPKSEVGLKWPNDLVYCEPQSGPGSQPASLLRKLGGVLAELHQGVLCVGWGLNLHTNPSLAHARSWQQLDPAGLAALGPQAAASLAEALRLRFEQSLSEWRQAPESMAARLSQSLDQGAMACIKGRTGILPETGLKTRVLALLPDGRLQVEALEGPQNGRRLALGSGELLIDYGS